MSDGRNHIADLFDDIVAAIARKGYGAPSNWGGPVPRAWHLQDQCSPRDASMHDNGVVDAMKAVREYQADSGALRQRGGR